MHRSSIFKLKIDFEKSHDAFLVDKNSGREFLDFFGMYSTLTLGYSHPVFKERAFWEAVQRTAHLRITNCEMASSEAEKFLQTFSGHPAMRPFKHFHFCCTGALGIEAAIKLAIDQKGSQNPKIISLKENFHGINGYGGFVTDRFDPVRSRLEGFPEMGWAKIHNPKIVYKNNQIDLSATEEGLKQFKKELESLIREGGEENIAALLIEPVQATAGDHYFPDSFFQWVREWCDRHQVCLIFDEIQTGFGVTGQMWYHQHQNMLPDIVVFGKKAQVCGVMFQEQINKTLQRPIRLEVTWDGDLIDMIRSTAILEAFEKYKILENVKLRGEELLEGLKLIPGIQNVRGEGLLVAFDLESKEKQAIFCQKAFAKGLLLNRTRDITVRLRPPLTVSKEEVTRALDLMRR